MEEMQSLAGTKFVAAVVDQESVMRNAQFLMQTVVSIPTFKGSRIELNPFLVQMEVMYEIIFTTLLNDSLQMSVFYQFRLTLS